MRYIALLISITVLLQMSCSRAKLWKVYSVKSKATCVNSYIDTSYYNPSYVEFDNSFTPKANTWYKTGTQTIVQTGLTGTAAYIYIKIGSVSDQIVGTYKVADLKEYASPCE